MSNEISAAGTIAYGIDTTCAAITQHWEEHHPSGYIRWSSDSGDIRSAEFDAGAADEWRTKGHFFVYQLRNGRTQIELDAEVVSGPYNETIAKQFKKVFRTTYLNSISNRAHAIEGRAL